MANCASTFLFVMLPYQLQECAACVERLDELRQALVSVLCTAYFFNYKVHHCDLPKLTANPIMQ